MMRKIAILVTYLALIILTTMNAIASDYNVSKILWIIAAVCWGLLFFINVVELFQRKL